MKLSADQVAARMSECPGWKLEKILPSLGDRACEIIAQSAQRKGPFFLYMPLTAPHTPLAVNTAWTDSGPDLGSATVDSLKKPRIAVVADAPADETAYGAIWFLLERRLEQPFTALRAPKIFNLRSDPFEIGDQEAMDWNRWWMEHIFLLVPAQQYVGQFLATFKEFPPSQKPGSFSLDNVLKALEPPTN